MAEEEAADRASQEIKALLRRLDPKGAFACVRYEWPLVS